ncbi:uncharacterized protein [Panulirus ornatus]|uniref:uncharacterized protein n=1 Tax=Panulirus ornatus TaxID=150431 RepID=UPI003A899A0C
MAVRLYHLTSRLYVPVGWGVRKLADGAGSGAGAGGGTGGSIRDAGGALGKRAVAQEEQYFRKLEREQMEKLRKELHDSPSLSREAKLNAYLDRICSHEEHIRDHQQEADFHRNLALTHQAKLEYHENQIHQHQAAVAKLQDEIRKFGA